MRNNTESKTVYISALPLLLFDLRAADRLQAADGDQSSPLLQFTKTKCENQKETNHTHRFFSHLQHKHENKMIFIHKSFTNSVLNSLKSTEKQDLTLTKQNFCIIFYLCRNFYSQSQNREKQGKQAFK